MFALLKHPNEIARARAALTLGLVQLKEQGEFDRVREDYQRMRLEVFVCSFITVEDDPANLAARAIERFLRKL